MELKNKQDNFIHGLIVWATINAALQRSNTYGENSPNDKRWNMRVYMQSQLEGIAEEYKNDVSDERHIENISAFADAISEKHGSILIGKRFRIGIAQKALNLYLKYMWCQGNVKTPPHCPFDRIVLNELYSKLDGEAKIDWNAAENSRFKWTGTDNLGDYKAWVKAARDEAKKDGYASIAEWELILWGQEI